MALALAALACAPTPGEGGTGGPAPPRPSRGAARADETPAWPGASAGRGAAEDAELAAALDLDGAVGRGEVEAAQVALWRDGGLVASVAAGPGATEPMPIGSLTKLLTVATALRLSEAGRLDLSAPVGSVVPALGAAAAPGASATDLMAHRAGLVADWLPGMWIAHPPDWRRLPAEMEGVAPVPRAGRWTQYSNIGATALGLWIERVAGEPYRAAVRAWILDPLGSGLTFERPAGVDEPTVRLVPAGGAYGTARDLGTVVALALGRGPSPWSEALAARMCRPYAAPLPLDLDLRYGLGFALVHGAILGRGRVCWHRGSTPRHGAFVMVLPDEDLAVAAIARGDDAPKVAERLALRAVGASAPDTIRPPEVPGGARTARAGTYVTDLGLVTITQRDAEVHLSFEGRGTELVPLLDGTYRMADPPGLRLAFARVEGLDLLVGIEGSVHERLGVRLPEPGPIPPAWRARVGSYRLDDPHDGPAGQVALALAGGRLVLIERGGAMEAGRRIRHVLLPEGEGRAWVAGLGRAGGSQVIARGGTLQWRGLRLVPQPERPSTRVRE